MPRFDSSRSDPQRSEFRLSQSSVADAVFYVALLRDEAEDAGRVQEAARWQAVLRGIDELERVKRGPGMAVH
jgi:hypothetical protein